MAMVNGANGVGVSIHATLAGGDLFTTKRPVTYVSFLSTPPSRVATLVGKDEIHAEYKFLSTPPSRVATSVCVDTVTQRTSFYPRHPRGWRRRCRWCCPHVTTSFYPRHPRGWRLTLLWDNNTYGTFLSTPPSRVATCCAPARRTQKNVSIHATLAGGDPLGKNSDRGRRIVSIHATLAGGDQRDG